MDDLKEKPGKQAEVGKRIRQLRRSMGLKQEEFAKMTCIGNSYLSGIEKGFKYPKFDFFYNLALRFNVSLDYLFFGVEPRKINDKISPPGEEKKYVSEILTLEDLLWLMNHSKLFNDTVMSYASKFQLDNEAIIMKNIEKTKKRKIYEKKEGKSENEQEE